MSKAELTPFSFYIGLSSSVDGPFVYLVIQFFPGLRFILHPIVILLLLKHNSIFLPHLQLFLQWLPIVFRIQFKLLKRAYKSPTWPALACLFSIISCHCPIYPFSQWTCIECFLCSRHYSKCWDTEVNKMDLCPSQSTSHPDLLSVSLSPLGQDVQDLFSSESSLCFFHQNVSLLQSPLAYWTHHSGLLLSRLG